LTLPKLMQQMFRIAIVLMAGTLMQFNFTCTGAAERLANNVNPCGTIFNCDPVEWDLLRTPFPDWSIDPTCTIPGQCGGTWPTMGEGAAAQ
jgi:hypothetical protein